MQPRSGAIYSNMRAMSPNNQDISATHLGETSVTQQSLQEAIIKLNNG